MLVEQAGCIGCLAVQAEMEDHRLESAQRVLGLAEGEEEEAGPQ